MLIPATKVESGTARAGLIPHSRWHSLDRRQSGAARIEAGFVQQRVCLRDSDDTRVVLAEVWLFRIRAKITPRCWRLAGVLDAGE
jgi:hypothetical protein